jgi:hypothetical protein
MHGDTWLGSKTSQCSTYITQIHLRDFRYLNGLYVHLCRGKLFELLHIRLLKDCPYVSGVPLTIITGSGSDDWVY